MLLVTEFGLSAQEPVNSEVESLKQELEITQSQTKYIAEQIIKINGEIEAAKTTLQLKNDIIDSLKKELNKVNSKNSNKINIESEKKTQEAIQPYQSKLVELSSRFLFIPFESYTIESVAINSFEAAKGSAEYARHQLVLQLLRSYRTDMQALIEFIVNAENSFKNGTPNKAALLVDLSLLSFIDKYKGLKDWENTYLIRQCKLVKEAIDNNSSDSLSTIKKRLQTQLNT